MQYVLYVLTALYAVLCVIAAASQLKSAAKRDTPILMLLGSALLLCAVLFQVLWSAWGWLFAIAGGVLIFLAAFQNGRRGGSFHLLHHIIRGVITLLLVLGFLLL